MQIKIKTVLYKIWESGNICEDNNSDFYQKINKTRLFCLGFIRPTTVANILETLIDECEAQRHEGASLVNMGHNQSDSTNIQNHILAFNENCLHNLKYFKPWDRIISISKIECTISFPH